MPLVDRRYAEALIDISVQNKEIDAYQQDFQYIVDVFNKQEDFKFFLLSPEINADIKKDTLKKLFDGSIKPELLKFLMLLLDKGRIKFLPGMFDEFVNMADKKRNILSITIVSTSPLSATQISAIKEKYRKVYNASSVKAANEIDLDLIGGIKVKIGDEVIDGSIKGRFEDLRNLLLNK